MSQNYYPDHGSSGRAGSFSPSRRPPSYMTVGPGSASAAATALMATLDHDSGYGSVTDDAYNHDGSNKSWHPGLAADFPTQPQHPSISGDSHVHHQLYNRNRAALGRQITKTIKTLEGLQDTNSRWPAQYPSVRDPQTQRPDLRRAAMHTQSTTTGSDLHRQIDNTPMRPTIPNRAASSLGENSSAESSASAETRAQAEPERLITAQSAQNFSVLKLRMDVQGFTQAEIAHSMKKDSIASLLDGRINQSIRHLLLLRDRIEDPSSKVLVTGDLNAGKSTFCNALLRRKILPEDQQPCTSIFCEVVDAKENGNLEEAHAVHKETAYDRNDESTYDVYRLEELEKIVTDNERYNQCKVYVRDIRKIDESLLNNGVVDISIIDAPGLNSDSLKTTAVFARQEEIDVVVFVVSAANHFTLSAKDFIWNAAHEKDYIFIVVNGFDNIRDKDRCERMILEQVGNLSPTTSKKSIELVHFVSSNAIPVAPAGISSNTGGDESAGGSGGSGSFSGSSEDFPPPEDEDEPTGKHGEPGSPPEKGKGKDMEKIQDFEQLESSLRRFVLEKRAQSKLAPAKTYLLNLLSDLDRLADVNCNVAQAELDRVSQELEEIEPAFEESKKACTEVSDDIDNTIEGTCSGIYNDTQTMINNAILQVATFDLGVPYPGLFSAFQYAEDIKAAMLEKISNAVDLCEQKAKSRTVGSVNTIKSLGLLHLGKDYNGIGDFIPDKMFSKRRDILAREVDFDVEIGDFFDISGLWARQEKVAGTSMALTVAGVVGGRMIGGFNYVDGVLGAAKIMGSQNLRRLIVPGLIATTVLAAAYALASIPSTLPPRLSSRISSHLTTLNYTHNNAYRIVYTTRRVLDHPAHTLRKSLEQSVEKLESQRKERVKVRGESEVARKYFGNLLRDVRESRGVVADVDLERSA